MYKVISNYDKQKVEKMNKATLKKSIVTSSVLAVLLVAVGTWNIVSGLTAEKINWLSVIVGAFACVICVLPLWNSIKTSKTGVQNAVKEMGVDKADLKIEYLFKEKRIEIKKEQGDSVILDTIMFKNVTLLKKTNQGLAFYLQDNTMYFFDYNDVVVGTKEQIISLFTKNGISIKKA